MRLHACGAPLLLAIGSQPHVRINMLSPMSDEAKTRLLQAGFAVPGMAEMAPKMSSSAMASARECTRDNPCDIDSATALDFLGSLALTPGPVLLLCILAYSVGVQAFADEEPGTERLDSPAENASPEWLVRQAASSRARRLERLRDLGRRLRPVQDWTGWQLVAKDDLPRLDAWAFLGVAIAAQLWVFNAVADLIRDAMS